MAILGVIGALIGAVLFGLWRVNSAAQAVRGLAEAADDAHGFWRRLLWRRKLAGDRLELVKEPQEAAAGMLVAVAQADGALTQTEQAALLGEFEKTFSMTPAQAQELLAHARWTVGESHDLDRCLYKLSQKFDPEQKRDAAAMLGRIAAADGAANPTITAALDKYNRSLKP